MDRLTEYLRNQNEDTITLTFDQIEEIIGRDLIPSARIHQAFWSNGQGNNYSHFWLDAGYSTRNVQDSLARQQITFQRSALDMNAMNNLTEYLRQNNDNRITLTFDQIEEIIGRNLIPSARSHQAFWSNGQGNNYNHFWLDAGYETDDVARSMRNHQITFMKKPFDDYSQVNRQNNQNHHGNNQVNDEITRMSRILRASKNIILHGAPGTGKSYLAKQIAANIISDGNTDEYNTLTNDQKQQVEFVQFHPSYDYTDFVEGLRPIIGDDDTMSFELRDGLFKAFVDRARKNAEESDASLDFASKEETIRAAMEKFFSEINFGIQEFSTEKTKFTINSIDDKYIRIYVPAVDKCKDVRLRVREIKKLLESDQTISLGDISPLFGRKYQRREDSFALAIVNEIKKRMNGINANQTDAVERKEFVFIIDEINRGEISKIFGELFYSIDPGYRGPSGQISTQYSNLHDDPSEKFYIPDNVYIIGTMNDIDRSVDSFDFAMRRRFRFIEISAEDSEAMLSGLGNLQDEAMNRMEKLNEMISATSGLGKNYQIGAAYFLKLKGNDNGNGVGFDTLWRDYLEPLLKEYIRGMQDEDTLLGRFYDAYNLTEIMNQNDEPSENQG